MQVLQIWCHWTRYIRGSNGANLLRMTYSNFEYFIEHHADDRFIILLNITMWLVTSYISMTS